MYCIFVNYALSKCLVFLFLRINEGHRFPQREMFFLLEPRSLAFLILSVVGFEITICHRPDKEQRTKNYLMPSSFFTDGITSAASCAI